MENAPRPDAADDSDDGAAIGRAVPPPPRPGAPSTPAPSYAADGFELDRRRSGPTELRTGGKERVADEAPVKAGSTFSRRRRVRLFSRVGTSQR